MKFTHDYTHEQLNHSKIPSGENFEKEVRNNHKQSWLNSGKIDIELAQRGIMQTLL